MITLYPYSLASSMSRVFPCTTQFLDDKLLGYEGATDPWNCMPGYGNRSFTCWESIRSVVRGSSSRVWIKDSPKADMNDWAWLSTLKFGHFMHVTFPCIQFKAIQVVIYKLHGEREYSRESLENGNTFQQVIKDHDNGEKFMENVQQNQASIDGEGEGHHK